MFEARAARASKQCLSRCLWAGDGRRSWWRKAAGHVMWDRQSPSAQCSEVHHSLLWWGPGNHIFIESADDFNAQFLRTSASKDYIFKVCLLCSVTTSYPVLATLWTVAHQAPLSTRFSRQEYWSGLPFPSPGDLPDPGIELVSPILATWEASYFFSIPTDRLLLF